MALQRLLRYYHTIKLLKLEQIFYRLKYRLRPLNSLPEASSDKLYVERWVLQSPFVPQQSLFEDGEVCFLNIRSIIRTPADWNDESRQEKLWLYNLHYFDDLNSVGAEERIVLQKDFLLRWINENPPLVGNGWEPYPISLRLVNWIKWCQRNQIFDDEILVSIEQQADALMGQLEYHILGNHLFANAKALVFVGCFLRSKKSDGYQAKGLEILQREVPEQFLLDGGHFELSPMYHCILLWDMLELFELSQVTQQSKVREHQTSWRTVIEKGLVWLKVMCHPDGDISFFNDAAFEIAPKRDDIEKYAALVGIPFPELELEGLTTLKSSGYSRLQVNKCLVIFDHAAIGPTYLPGHAHADNLSFELSLGAERVFVNSGTSTYESGSLREFQRSTSAHNTVNFMGQSSSEMWASFRVSRRAKATLIGCGKSADRAWCEASHNGFERIKPQSTHQRQVVLQNGRFKIIDSLPYGKNAAVANFYLHPDVEVLTPKTNSGTIKLKLHSGKTVHFRSNGRVQVHPAKWYPAFGKSLNTQKIEVEFLDDVLETRIEWDVPNK